MVSLLLADEMYQIKTRPRVSGAVPCQREKSNDIYGNTYEILAIVCANSRRVS